MIPYPRRILLLGACGHVGLGLQRSKPPHIELRALGHRELDICDLDGLYAEVKEFTPDGIINSAAYTAVDRAEADGSIAYSVNRDGAAHCALAAQEVGARLIHISTDFVFDGTQPTPYLPSSQVTPLSVYGRSKAEGEARVLEILGGDALVLRTAWVYGVDGNNFVKSMLRVMAEGEILRVGGDQLGTPTWAASIAGAIWRSLDHPNFTGIHHWTDAGVASRYDFAMAIQEEALSIGYLQRAIPIEMVRSGDYPLPARRPACAVLDKFSSYSVLGPAPHWRVSLRNMLMDLKMAGGIVSP